MLSNPLDATPKTSQEVLVRAIPLFAEHGYDGVSMRDVAAAVGISAPALYHHFSDKQALYLAVMAHAFADKSMAILGALDGEREPLERLEHFIRRFTALMAADASFRSLLMRELLDGDEPRLRLLAQTVFQRPFQALAELAKELAPEFDPSRLSVSVVGLVLFPMLTAPLGRFLANGPESDDHEALARHVLQVLGKALGIRGPMRPDSVRATANSSKQRPVRGTHPRQMRTFKPSSKESKA